jgi:formylglycine-generating enzyme required for sulfatase activity
MDKYEVTQIEFEKVMGKNPSKYKGDNLPVERVLWNEAQKYCERVGKRLPTEAEWEKAAKGGKNTLYPWGNEVVSGMANFCDVNCKAYFKAKQFDDGFKGTAPVGSYPPNGYGLHDMAGNVWEWVSDWIDKNYYKSAPRKNPKGPPKGMKKVLRGGSWGNNASAMRSSTRSWAHNNRVSRRGFRCALDTPSKT